MIAVNMYNAATAGDKDSSGETVWWYDWYVRSYSEAEFSDFAQAIQSTCIAKHKQEVKMWNFVRQNEGYKSPNPKGLKRNDADGFTGISALVLDYDSELSIQEFIERHEGLSYVLHSTHSHKSERKKGADCFRVILELKDDIPLDLFRKVSEYNESILPALCEMFPEADHTCFEMQRAHFLPSSPKDECFFHVEAGEPFEWQVLNVSARLPKRELYKNQVSARGGSGRLIRSTLDLYSLFRDSGWIRSENGKLVEVQCPNYTQHSSGDGARLIDYNGKYQFKCQHSHCGATKFVTDLLFSRMSEKELRPYCEAIVEHLELKRRVSFEEPADETEKEDGAVGTVGSAGARDVTTVPVRTFRPVSSSAQRTRTCVEFVNTVLKSTNDQFALRTPEGFGKSTSIVSELVKRGKDVLFCCASNAQAHEKCESFKEYGASRAYSTSALLAEHGISASMIPSEAPWGVPRMNVPETLEAIVQKQKCTMEEAEEFLQGIKDEAMSSRNSSAQVLVTTFAMGNMMFNSSFGRLSRVIVLDDPSTSDLCRFKCVSLEVTAERAVTDVVFGQEFAWQDKIIWTTTEKLVIELIRTQHPLLEVRDVKQSIETEARILLLPTDLVRSDTKKILPGIAKSVMKDTKSEQRFIANGARAELNLVSTKGRNDLRGDSVIVISFPHPDEVLALVLSLELDSTEQDEVRRQMVVDVIDQGLGREHGYRTDVKNSCNSLVLVEPHLEVSVRMRSRYRLNTPEGLRRRGRFHGVPLVMSVHQPNWWTSWFGYISTWDKYVLRTSEGIFNALPLVAGEISPDELKLLEKRLAQPTEFSEFVWSNHKVIIEGDGVRRNFHEVLPELIDQFNKLKAAGRPKVARKTNRKPRVGTKPFVFENQSKRFVPGEEPSGWVLDTTKKLRTR